MGQTLPNGIYLPAEGERNCYDGLEGNWRSLDGLISTVSGKASATHTHGNITNDGKVGTTANLPLITGTGGVVQAGAFGNQANTFCEGNDSRLSDARTPVAHTHTKSDVTDLLNSNFIPSANNSYDLGSSSYQWKSVYAQSYYYNGVAWGLDKANTWTGDNTFTAVIRYKTSYTLGNPPQSSDAQQSAIMVTDSAGTNYLAQIATFQSANATGCRITIRDKFDSNGFSPSGSNRNKYFYLVQNISNQGYLKWDGYIDNSISPLADNTYNLGNSTLKWKTLNGINPGALSLPDMSSGTGVSLSAGSNSYSPPSSGWLSINLTGAISVVCGNFCHSGTDMLSVPVVKGSTYTVTVATSGTAYLFVSQGNV